MAWVQIQALPFPWVSSGKLPDLCLCERLESGTMLVMLVRRSRRMEMVSHWAALQAE